MVDSTVLRKGLGLTLQDTDFKGLGRLYRGKVRDNYSDAEKRTIIVSDRISAFDVVLGTIPFKGQVLNGIARYWFEKTKHIAPNHLIAVPDPSVSVVKECTPFSVEMVVRGYLTGSSPTSLWTAYNRGDRTFCGHKLEDGMRKHQKLLKPLITPTTKAGAGEHDENISAAEVVSRGLCSAAEFEELSSLCLQLFALGTQLAEERGLILVDTKYELGRAPDGKMVFIDEIHTPDSSRYWYADSYEEAMRSNTDPRPLDKEFLRRRLIEQGYDGRGPAPKLDDELRLEVAQRYVELFERVTGQTFQPNIEPPLERIQRNLGLNR